MLRAQRWAGIPAIVPPLLAAALALSGLRALAGPSSAPGAPGAVPHPMSPSAREFSEKDRYWVSAEQVVDHRVMDVLSQHQQELAKGVRYHKLMHGSPTLKEVALTFDDGPHPQYTPKLLAILRQYKVPATFFVVGEMAEKYPDLVKAELADGNLVANHTYHHVNLTKIPAKYVATEIKACGEVVQSITGRAPRLFRPPGGDYNRHVAEVADALGYTIALWTDDPGDYASPGTKIITDRLLARVSNGGIILIHDGVQQTIDVLPAIIQTLQGKGFRFVTLDEMSRQRRVESRPPELIARRG